MTLPVPRHSSQPGRWDPWRELDDLQQRMTHLMSATFGLPGLAAADHHLAWRPLADIVEHDDGYLVEVDLPGVKRSDVEVQAAGRELCISGELKEKERSGWLRTRTRRVGRFEYRTLLPQDVDSERITADLADGVLTVRAPKHEAAKPRRIQITG